MTVAFAAAAAGGERVSVELAAASTSISYANDAAWGWWQPGKYDEWRPDERSELDLAEARVLVPGETYTIFIGGEWYPTMRAGASFSGDDGETVEHELETDLEVYDLGLGQYFGKDAETGVRPWVGLTHMRIDEVRAVVADQPVLPDEATSRLWGVGVGADGSYQVGGSLAITGRLVIRWAQGTRKAVFSQEDSTPGDPQVERVEVSDSTDRLMLGGELGVRWSAAEAVQLEGGWRLRDWRHGNGPASFNGPFVRLVVGL